MFPRWIPEWVIKESTQFTSEVIAELFWSPEMPSWIEKVITSERLKATWLSLGSQSFNDRWNEGRLYSLYIHLEEGLSGFERNTMTKAEREKISSSIEELAKKLAEQIESLVPLGGNPKWAEYFFNSKMADCAKDHVTKGIESSAKYLLQEIPERFESERKSGMPLSDLEIENLRPAMQSVSEWLVLQAIWGDLPFTLKYLAQTAHEFGEFPQFIKMPNHPNAKRLYFIRTLTGYFLQHYGRPLRKECLMLTSVYFECDDIEESDLSRLAPVSKYKNGRFNAGE